MASPMSAGARAEPPRRRGRVNAIPAHRRYSRFVGVMKILLPALAAILLGLVVSWPRLTRDDSHFQVGFSNLSSRDVETLSMVNARFHGVDARNRPFTVTSEIATERDPAKGLIELDSPKADFSTNSGDSVYMEATRGFYRQKDQILTLTGTVNLFHDKGYEVHTASAEVDLAKGTAWGSEPVDGQGPQGAVQSEGFEIRDNGREILFTGRAHLTLKGAGKE